jgi:hypothetical protein
MNILDKDRLGWKLQRRQEKARGVRITIIVDTVRTLIDGRVQWYAKQI